MELTKKILTNCVIIAPEPNMGLNAIGTRNRYNKIARALLERIKNERMIVTTTNSENIS
jgi:hypothetical protein